MELRIFLHKEKEGNCSKYQHMDEDDLSTEKYSVLLAKRRRKSMVYKTMEYLGYCFPFCRETRLVFFSALSMEDGMM